MTTEPLPSENPPLRDRVANACFVAMMGVARLLPYHRRIPAVGWLVSRIVAPLAGWRKRVRDNLSFAMPEMDEAERHRLERAVPDNAGRALAEIYSGAEFTRRIHADTRIEGPGLAALEQAAESGRPVILACAHFGNYDAMRAALSARGWPVGALYRPMNNTLFNDHYIPAIRAIAEPLFPRGRAGFAAMLRFLRGGGILALGFDQYDHHAPELRFFERPTRTVLTPAELALRYDALLVPVAGVRLQDGLRFRVEVGAPVPHSTPEPMMQALNDDLEALIRRHPEQWFWIHRRWKS